MNRRQGLALVAGVIYLAFAVFSAGTLWLWLGYATSGGTDFDALPGIPGAVELLVVFGALLLATLFLGGWLSICRSVNRIHLGCGIAVVIVAIGWNYGVAALLAVPVALLCFAYAANSLPPLTSVSFGLHCWRASREDRRVRRVDRQAQGPGRPGKDSRAGRTPDRWESWSEPKPCRGRQRVEDRLWSGVSSVLLAARNAPAATACRRRQVNSAERHSIGH